MNLLTDDPGRQILQVAYLGNAVVVLVIRAVYQRRTRRETATLRMPAARDAGLLVLAFAAMVVLPLTFLLSRGFAGADYHLPLPLGLAGVPIGVLGTWLFWRAHRDLGLNWSARLRIRSGHALVTDGIYRNVRHPMYAAMLVCGIAQCLLLQNWMAGPWLLVVGLVFLVVRVPAEESMMLGQFGDEYRLYMTRTGRVLPRWRQR
jgi:protein-S-isoprenylcysteine O-methyltransferase Ste14